MTITIKNLPPIQGVDPSSLEEDRDRELAAAQEQLRKDFPGIRFGDLPTKAGAGAPPPPPAVPAGIPERFTYGADPEPVQQQAPAEEAGWLESIAAGARIGTKLFSKLNEGAKLGIQDEVAEDPQAAMQKYLNRRDGPGPSLASVLPKATQEKYKQAAEIEAAKSPEQRNAEREKILANIAAINEEMAGLRPKTDDFWKNAAVDATSSIVFMTPALVAGAATGGATVPLSLAALGTYYVSYADHRASGADPAKAKALSFVDGVTEAVTELLPAKALFARTGIFKKFLTEIAADVPGEQIANLIQTTTAKLAELPNDPSNDQIKEAIRAGAAEAWEQKEEVAGATVLTGGAMAGTARAAQAIANRGEKPEPKPQPPPRTGAPPTTPAAGPATPAAGGGAATTPVAPPQPAAAPATAAAPQVALPKQGDPLMFTPSEGVPGTPVVVAKVDPRTQTAIVARVNEEGEPLTDDEGAPVTFVATFADLGIKAPPPAAAGGQPQQTAPLQPSQVPPAATSTEPTSDIDGQIKDMYRARSNRRGVYVSPDTVAKMKKEGSYDKLLNIGVVAENFDGQGGTLIVKSKKDMQEAVAARDGGQTDMQAIVGALTGAGVAKPNVPKPAVVQRKDEAGAVVQQSAVAPEQAPAVAAAMAQQPGTVEITTPEVALAERDAKVEAEAAQEVPPAVEEPAPVQAKTPLGQLPAAVAYAARALRTTKGPNSYKMDVREAANAVGVLAQSLRLAIAEAQQRGATAEDVKQAADAAKKAERLTEKDADDFNKSRGVSEKIVRERMAELSDAADSLIKWAAQPLQSTGELEPKKAKKAKAVSKKKESQPESDRRKSENAALRERVEKMTPEERERAIMRHDLTGLPNRRAMEGVEAPAWAEVDADSLKWVNDNMGEEAGNELLKAVGTALENADGVTAYHISGDEFYVSGESQEQIEAALKAVAKTLAGQTIEGQGHTMSPAITWGTGETRKAASTKMKSHKAAREKAGKRAKRGETPPTAKKTAKVFNFEDAEDRKFLNDWAKEKYAGLPARIQSFLERHAESPLRFGTVSMRRVEEALAKFGEATTDLARRDAMALIEYELDMADKVYEANKDLTDDELMSVSKYKESQPKQEPVQPARPTASRTRGKQKYVPPKKRTDSAVAEEVVEATAPPAREIIPIVAQSVEGQEAQLITELLGATPQELAMEAKMDKSGALTKVLQSILQAMANRGNWTGWFAAVTRGGVLERDQRNAMYGKIRQYAAAQKQELDAAREDLLGFMTDIDGKTLPPQAIEAVMEAAAAARAFNIVASNVEAQRNEDAAEIMGATTQAAGYVVDPNTGEQIFDQDLVSVREGVIARARGSEELPSTLSILDGMIRNTTNKFGRAILDLNRELSKNRFIHRLVTRGFVAQKDGKHGISTHEILDSAIFAADNMIANEYMANPDVEPGVVPLRRLLASIRRAVPNVPVEFIESGGIAIDAQGRPLRTAGGRWHHGGLLQIEVDMNEDGGVEWSTFNLRTLIHELTHGATVYEIERDPESPIARELDRLRREIVLKAKKKYGADVVDEVLEYYNGPTRGTGTPPASVQKYGRILYGITNTKEMVAETLSNPMFHEFVNSLDQSPLKTWVRNTLSRILRSVSRLFTNNPKDSRIMTDLMVASLRTMHMQQARQQRRSNKFVEAVDSVTELLDISRAEAANIVNAAYFDEELSVSMQTLPKLKSDEYGRMSLTDVPPPRGTPVAGRTRTWDRMAGSVYTQGPERLSESLAESRRAFAYGQEPGFDAMPRLRNQEELSRLTSPALVSQLRRLKRLMKSKAVDSAKDLAMGIPTMDFLVRRWSHLFGSQNDATNPMQELKVIRETRRSFANQMMELAERTVNSKWMKLSLTQSEQLGDMLQQTTLWQIDPDGGPNQKQRLRGVSKRAWQLKVAEIEAAWNKLSPEQQDIYHSVQKYFKTEYSKLRRASMDLAVDLYGVQLTPQQRSLLYALQRPDGVDALIGTGKPIDLGDQNDRFTKVVKDLVKVSAISGPYFPLMRQGKYVVEAEQAGILQDENGEGREFTNKDDANDAADDVRAQSPKNRARVRAVGDKFVVEYKLRHTSFHKSQNEAQEAVDELKANGFAVKGDGYTRKLESVEDSNLSGGLSELINKAEALATKGGTDTEREAVMKTIRTAFTQILAERAASASSQLKRQGVAGFKGKEAHETFTRRVRASSWHFANLKTTVPLQRAVTRLRKFSVDADEGYIPPGHTRQSVLVARGRVLHEMVERMRVESGEFSDLGEHNVDHWMGQAGFATFLATPSYAAVNAMQNFNVALPVMTGKYGAKGARALLRGMRVVAGPAFGRAMRGLVSKPGEVTTYDVYTAIAKAVSEDPRYARFAQSPDGGKTPSALQQLVDRNVINATYVQELTSVGNDQNLLVSKGMDYMRLLPQGTELWNRVSTALAVLDVTNGNVNAAADMIDQVHFQYSLENRPRYFRKIGKMRLPQAITMFKMYGVGMLQLTASLMVDTIGKNKTMEARRQSAMSLAGVIAAHTFSAGIIGGVMVEPLRVLIGVWQMLFGDDDEFSDLDTMIQQWATEVTGSKVGGQILSKGAWNAIGFDLSGRTGLDRILLYNPPEGADEDSFWKFMGATLVGPLVAENVRRGYRAYDLAVMKGKPLEAIMQMVPLKAFTDARRAWEIMSKGVTTRSGEEIVSPDAFNALDAAGRLAGFRTSEEAKATSLANTEFRYKNWKQVRMRQLTTQYWQARDSGDEREIAKAQAAIARFREKNPSIRFTSQNLLQSKRSSAEAARSRVGEGRQRDLREQLAY